MESEFVALEKARAEAEWLRNLLIDIPIWKRPVLSVSIHCDNVTPRFPKYAGAET